MTRRHHVNRAGGRKKHHIKRSRKVKLLDTIRSLRARAAVNRLRGRIQDAMFFENHLDRAFAEAEAKGWSEPATAADEAGLRIAHRLARK